MTKSFFQNFTTTLGAFVLDNMHEGVIVVNATGLVFYTNPSFDRMAGYEIWSLNNQMDDEFHAPLIPTKQAHFRARLD